MSADDFDLPPRLERCLQQVCSERSVPKRRHDELRALLLQAEESWPACCRGKCEPCIDDQADIAREIRERAERDPDGGG
jgi:hypothetical protein